MIAAFACGGHVLLEDVPGTAKTVLARALAGSIEGSARCAHPVHARPPADRRHRPVDLEPADAGVRVPAGPDLRERRPRRRDQPRAAEGAVRAARGDGRAPGDRRRRDAAAAGPVPPDRDREPDRAGRHVPAARGAARPFPAAHLARLSDASTRRSRILDDQRHGHPAHALRPVVDARRARRAPRRVEHVYVDPLLQALGRRARARDARRSTSSSVGASVRASLALERAARAWALVARPRIRRAGGRRAALRPVVGHHRMLLARSSSSTRSLSQDEVARRVWDACLERAPRPEPDWDGATAAPRRERAARRGRSRSSRGGASRSRSRASAAARDAAKATRPRARARTGRATASAAIDWAASARLSAARGADEFVVREFFAEQAPRVVVVCDRRPRSGSTAPRSVARQAAAATAEIVARRARRARERRAVTSRTQMRQTPSAAFFVPRPAAAAYGTLARRTDREPAEGAPEALGRSLALLVRRRSVLPGRHLRLRGLGLPVPPEPVGDAPALARRHAGPRPGPGLGAVVPAHRRGGAPVAEPGRASQDVWIGRAEPRTRAANEQRLR